MSALEAAGEEIQILFLSAWPDLTAKILGLFKRLMGKQKTMESGRMALNPGSTQPLMAPSQKEFRL